MNLKEIYQALGEGKAIRHETWPSHRRISIGLNLLTYETGELYENGFLSPMNWSIYEEPEDLDYKIESLITDIGFRLDGFADVEKQIALLIDLKIKQAKL